MLEVEPSMLELTVIIQTTFDIGLVVDLDHLFNFALPNKTCLCEWHHDWHPHTNGMTVNQWRIYPKACSAHAPPFRDIKKNMDEIKRYIRKKDNRGKQRMEKTESKEAVIVRFSPFQMCIIYCYSVCFIMLGWKVEIRFWWTFLIKDHRKFGKS